MSTFLNRPPHCLKNTNCPNCKERRPHINTPGRTRDRRTRAPRANLFSREAFSRFGGVPPDKIRYDNLNDE